MARHVNCSSVATPLVIATFSLMTDDSCMQSRRDTSKHTNETAGSTLVIKRCIVTGRTSRPADEYMLIVHAGIKTRKYGRWDN